MSKPMPRKRKEALIAKAKAMREAKRQRRSDTADTPEEIIEETSSSLSMDESFVLPAPAECSDILSNESSEDDENYEGEASDEEILSVYSDWIGEMEREDLKMLAMLLYDNYRKRFGLLKTSAAKEVALCLGIGEKTVRLWRKNFLENSSSFTVDGRGKYARNKVLDDEEYRDLALEWARSHAYVKGKPNVTALDFCTWVNSSLLPKVVEHHPSAPTKISARTACRWLHSLGFQKVSSKGGACVEDNISCFLR